MSVIKKFREILGKNKEVFEELKWVCKFEDEGINISCNKDISKETEIKSLLMMYDIDFSKSNELYISYSEIYDLYYDEYHNKIDVYKYFNLPEIFKGTINISNRNNFITDSQVYFSFKFKLGDDEYSILKENILESDLNNDYRLMPRKLFELTRKMKEYNRDTSKNSDEAFQFEMLKIIKDYTNEIDVHLNERLRIEEEPIVIDKIKIDFKDNGHELDIFPKFTDDEEKNKEILGNINSYDDLRGVYSSNEDGKRIRYVVKHRDTLETILKNKKTSGEDRLNILRGKSELFQDENIDISDFGPRVTGIGYLTYRNSASTVKTNDLNWLDNDVELPYIQGSNVDGQSKKITLTPKDKVYLQTKLVNMKISGEEVSEVEFGDDSGGNFKIIMSKDDIVNEISNINSRIKEPKDIKSVSKLEEIISICDNYEDENYIPYNGMYIEKGTIDIKSRLQEQLERLKEEGEEEKKSKRKTLLISENLENEEYREIEEIKKDPHKVEIPKSLREGINLFEYQEECLRRLQELYLSSEVNGFLLCDDMGLGKTLQLLSFLSWLKERDEVIPSLIVAPTSLLNNWDSNRNGEIQKFFKDNHFKTDRIIGTIGEDRVNEIKTKDIVFTTYDSLRINNIMLGKIHWKVMICDEAQKIKNPKTMVTIAAKAQNADFKIICSATPIENTLEDLWTLVDYSKPGLMGSLKEFKNKYIKRNDGSDQEELKELNNELTAKIQDFYIRREKDILPKALPKKSIRLYKVKPTRDEFDALECIKDTEEYTISAIQKMLAICSHVAAIEGTVVSKGNINSIINRSSKLTVIHDILKEIKEKDEKVIIFTRLRKIQKILHLAINEWFAINADIVNGEETNLDKRTKKISDFRKSTGFNVIILSPEVAGFGITITEANHVIHYTRLWNPAKEDQATDRVYRIGQTKDVEVHYPVISYCENGEYVYDDVAKYVEDNMKVKNEALSPEEKLNILLARKKDMLLNFFLAAGNGEINTKDFMNLDSKKMDEKQAISIKNVTGELMTPFEFECLIAVLYERLGYKTYLTSRSNDNGVDVLAINKEEVLYVQCKHTKGTVCKEAVKDVVYAMNTYKDLFKDKVAMGCIVTSSENISESVIRKDIKVMSRVELAKQLEVHKIFKCELDIRDDERYTYEKLRRIMK